MLTTLFKWIDENIIELGRELRWSYLPPLMVYMAAGISGLTNIVGAFFIKDYLGLSAEFLAALGFWAGIPWALKMPLGHLVDLIWRYKYILVFVGAGLIAMSLIIMIGLLAYTDTMVKIMPLETWFIISTLLAPIGYVTQDVVADAMTVEAVPHFNEQGQAIDKSKLRLMHTTMQTLGRVAIIGGGTLVYSLNIYMFSGVGNLIEAEKLEVYTNIYQLALLIPVVSVLGVLLGGVLKTRRFLRLIDQGKTRAEAWSMLNAPTEKPQPNWWILGGSLVFVIFTLSLGLSDISYNQEIIFAGSMAIVIFLISRLVKSLDVEARRVLLGTAIIIFIFRATPTPGPGSTWWMMDVLNFDQQFFSVLALISSSLTLLGMFIFRRFMAERSIAYVIVFLTMVGSLLSLPIIGMFYDLHVWTAAHTGGIVDAQFIALVDTALESPLGQIAMIPMLAWIANSAPANLKATFFAVMASFSNLALSLSQLGTKYINQVYTITREVKDRITGVVNVTEDYSELGALLITITVIGFSIPLLAILIVKKTRLSSA